MPYKVGYRTENGLFVHLYVKAVNLNSKKKCNQTDFGFRKQNVIEERRNNKRTKKQFHSLFKIKSNFLLVDDRIHEKQTATIHQSYFLSFKKNGTLHLTLV